MKLIAVDCNYVEKQFAASFLLVRNQRAFFIECNTTHAIPFLKKAAMDAGILPENVDGLEITHVHLDHAGGAGAFLQEFPNAKLYAHPRAARHAIDPSKLIASATAVYGEATLKKWYGTILPCDASRVQVLEDAAEIPFQDLKLKTKHLRGHANHHLVICEPETQTLFSGDSFGVAYPQITAANRDVVLASTSPTDFDANAALAAIDWIEAAKPAQVGLTHFGFVNRDKIPIYAGILRDQIRYAAELMAEVRSESLDLAETETRLRRFIVGYFASRGISLTAQDLSLLAVDLKVNAQGIHYASFK